MGDDNLMDGCRVTENPADGTFSAKFKKVVPDYKIRMQETNMTTTAKTAAASSSTGGQPTHQDLLMSLSTSLAMVHEDLLRMRNELSDFKTNCMHQIEGKVDQTHFADTVSILRAKLTQQERVHFNDACALRQDMRTLRERIQRIENDNSCAVTIWPIWPFLVFMAGYSVIQLGKR